MFRNRPTFLSWPNNVFDDATARADLGFSYLRFSSKDKLLRFRRALADEHKIVTSRGVASMQADCAFHV